MNEYIKSGIARITASVENIKANIYTENEEIEKSNRKLEELYGQLKIAEEAQKIISQLKEQE